MADKSVQNPARIDEALIDPAWGWGAIDVEGNKMVYLRLIHPRYGPIDSIIATVNVQKMVLGLSELIGQEVQ